MKPEFILTGLTALAATAAALFFAPWDGVSEILTLRLMYIAMLLAGAFGTLFVLRGTKYDVLREIFDENNTAAAVVVAAIFISMALVIGR